MIASIDGSFMLHRARFVMAKNGHPTRDHVVALFMGMLIRTLLQIHPSKVYIYFDRERSYHRLELYPDYKGHRTEDTEDQSLIAYKNARDFLVELLPTLGFITVLHDGIEADDFAYITAYTYAPGIHITDDRDWFGNLFPGWSVFRPKANELISYDQFCRLMSHTENPRMIYLIARAITGDKSDNIPGIRGVPWNQALLIAPLIFQHKKFGEGKYEKKVLDKMDQVRYNINIMTPVWVIRSEEARTAYEKAESCVMKDLSTTLVLWKAFGDQLSEEVQRDIRRLSFDYHTIARGLSPGVP